MNIVDEFLAAPTWDNAIPTVIGRHSELFHDDARAAFEAALKEYGRSEPARQVLGTYLQALQAIGRGNSLELQQILRGGTLPKLSKEQITALNAVTDARSAQSFVTRFRSIALDLIAGQVLYGDSFWRLLFAAASKVQSGSTESSRFVKVTVGVGYNGKRYRLFKVLPLSDGGFAVTAPYHVARTGSLMKIPLPTATGTYTLHAAKTIPFYASDRVKLSYHSDGFVQFSGENSSRILSGRDEVTGEPRGLGLMSQPLSCPVRSGPSVGCTAWGLTDFDAWRVRGREGAIIFETDDDFYSEPTERVEDGADGTCTVSIFVFPLELLTDAIGPVSIGDEISMPIPMNIYHREGSFRVKVVPVSPHCVIGLIANRDPVGFSVSGFELSGPGDGKHSMIAFYPALPVSDKGRSLDYEPVP